MNRPHAQAIEQALAAARSGEVVEVALEVTTTTTTTVAGGTIEASEDSRDGGMGIRLFHDGRVGFAATASLKPDDIARTVDRARDLAACSRPEMENQPAPASTDDHQFAEAPAPVPPASLAEPTTRMEAAARAMGDGISTRAASITAAGGSWILAHSGGLWRSWSWQRAWGALEVVARQDDVRQTGWETDWAETWDQLNPEAIGTAAARRALGKFGACRPATARQPVVLSPTVTAGLFEGLAEALSGKAVVRGRSLFAGKRGDTIASTVVNLTDDGGRSDGFQASPFDGEGNLSRRAVLIQDGVLNDYLHNTYTSLKLTSAPGGHAVRDGFSTMPHVGIRNLCLESSGTTREAIIGSVSQGVQVDEVMGLHTIDPVSGDFSLGATGRAIHGGVPGGPLEGFTIAGNVRDILNAVQAVADDLRFLPDGGGGSTVLLDGLTVSGS